MSRARQPSAAAARRFVAEVVQRHCGERATSIAPRGGGLTNLVFQCRVGKAGFIVRMHADAAKMQDYLKEQWAMVQAHTANVPTPRVLEVGRAPAGWPYMILEEVTGIEASHHPERLPIVAEMGRCAARLHRVRTHGYGREFDESRQRLGQRASWREYLECGLDAERSIETLRRHAMLSPAQLRALRRAVDEMSRWKRRPVLQHGDLRLKNVMVEADSGRIVALLDWENCLSAPAPYWDLSIALHDLGMDQKEALLDGYGLSVRSYERALPFLRAFNALNYAPAIAELAHQRDRRRLAWYQVRLAGGFDLNFT
jgi:aminoglycoside phosphotransferase (APT) family kinase protein